MIFLTGHKWVAKRDSDMCSNLSLPLNKHDYMSNLTLGKKRTLQIDLRLLHSSTSDFSLQSVADDADR